MIPILERQVRSDLRTATLQILPLDLITRCSQAGVRINVE
jgi:hypothetical protein